MHKHLNKNKSANQHKKLNRSTQIYQTLFRDVSTKLSQTENNLENNVKEIITLLQKVNAMVTEKDLGSFDLGYVKSGMQAVQKYIHNLKVRTKALLEVLEQDEERFCTEMQLFEQKYYTGNDTVDYLQDEKYIVPVSKNISAQTKSYLDFSTLSSTLDTSWNPNSHNVFFKCPITVKDVDKVLQTALTDRVAQELTKKSWYQKCIDLKDKQKAAIKSWNSDRSQLKRDSSQKMKGSSVREHLFSTFSELLNKEKLKRKIAAWRIVQEREDEEEENEDEANKEELENQEINKYTQIEVLVDKRRLLRKDSEEKNKLKKEFCQEINRATKEITHVGKKERLLSLAERSILPKYDSDQTANACRWHSLSITKQKCVT